MSREPLRVVHITDTHIVAKPGVQVGGIDSFTALESLLAVMQRDVWTPDLLLVTGDLSDDGSAASYQRLRDVLTPLGLPIYCIPGNHDVLSEMKVHFHGGPIHVTDHVIWDHWQMILLNSQVPGQDHGYLDHGELAALEVALQKLPRHHALVGLHHGPLPVCPMPGCRLANADDFLAFLGHHANIRGIVSGHNHCAVDEHRHGMRFFVTPSTCLYVEHPNGSPVPDTKGELHHFDPLRRAFRRLELHADGTIVSEVVWDSSAWSAGVHH